MKRINYIVFTMLCIIYLLFMNNNLNLSFLEKDVYSYYLIPYNLISYNFLGFLSYSLVISFVLYDLFKLHETSFNRNNTAEIIRYSTDTKFYINYSIQTIAYIINYSLCFHFVTAFTVFVKSYQVFSITTVFLIFMNLVLFSSFIYVLFLIGLLFSDHRKINLSFLISIICFIVINLIPVFFKNALFLLPHFNSAVFSQNILSMLNISGLQNSLSINICYHIVLVTILSKLNLIQFRREKIS